MGISQNVMGSGYGSNISVKRANKWQEWCKWWWINPVGLKGSYEHEYITGNAIRSKTRMIVFCS
jgi:hypothetical protein